MARNGPRNLYPPQLPLRFLYGSAMSYQMNSREVVSDIGQPRELWGMLLEGY